MTKNRNMGRRSHRAQDAEIQMTEPSKEVADNTDQTVRPSQHPAEGTKSSAEQPVTRHSRRGA